jgi:antitoxin MazE
MQSTVKKWGNSAAVRIPAALMQAIHLDLNDPVQMREENGRIVIEPLHEATYDLAALVKGITPKNRHQPADFGNPAGNEVW